MFQDHGDWVVLRLPTCRHCDQMARFFGNIGPLTKMKNCPIDRKNPKWVKIMPNNKYPLKYLSQFFYNLRKEMILLQI